MALFTSSGVAAALTSAGVVVNSFFATASVYVVKKKPKVKK